MLLLIADPVNEAYYFILYIKFMSLEMKINYFIFSCSNFELLIIFKFFQSNKDMNLVPA